MIRWLIFAVLLMGSVMVHGSENVVFAVYGLGTESCGKWIDARKTVEWFPHGHWVLGYLDATVYWNAIADKQLASTDTKAAFYWVDNYRAQYPLDKIMDAARELVS